MEPPSGVKSSTSNNTCSSDVFGQNSPRQPFIKAYRAKICLGEARKFSLVTNTLRKNVGMSFLKTIFFFGNLPEIQVKSFFHHVFRLGTCDIFARWRKFLGRVFHLREFSSEGNTYEKFRVIMMFKILDLS